MANALLAGQVTFPRQPTIPIKVPFDASNLVAGPPTHQLYVASLATADVLLSAFHQTGNAVLHRILHKRLQKQRRKRERAKIVGNVRMHLKAFSETGHLDLQVVEHEIEFLAQGGGFLIADVYVTAKELRKEKAHLAGTVGMQRRERTDGVETVEEEMRIDLGPERTQFGLPRQGLHPLVVALCNALVFERQQQVTHGDGQRKHDARKHRKRR